MIIGKSEKMVIATFISALLLCFLLFSGNIPEKNAVFSFDLPHQIELAGKISPANNFSLRINPTQDNLTGMSLYITKSSKDIVKEKNKIIFALKENGSILDSDSLSIKEINENFIYLKFDQLIENSRNRDLTLELSIAKLDPDGYVEIWQDADSGKILAEEKYLDIASIILRSFFLFLPSLLVGLVIVFLAIQEFSGKKFMTFSHGQLFVFFILPFLLLNGIYFIFWTNHWSPIDESFHYRFVQRIAAERSLPYLTSGSAAHNIQEREIFQPPLYYLSAIPAYAAAKISKFDPATFVRIWSILVYLALITVAFFFLKKVKSYFPFLENNLYFIFFLLFIGLSPSLIVRSAAISNGTFSAMTATLALLLGISYWEKDDDKKLAFFSVSNALAYLSRLTNLFTFPFSLALVAMKSKFNWRKVALFSLFFLVLISFWLMFNYKHYGTLTPNEIAKINQQEIVNPQNIKFGWSYIQSNSFPMFISMFVPEEYSITNGSLEKTIILLGSVLIIASLIFFSVKIVIKHKVFLDISKKEFIITMVTTFFLLNIFQQYAVLLKENWPVLLGRYLHSSFIPASFLAILFLQETLRRKRILILMLGFFSLLLVILNSLYILEIIKKFD